jgi:hypothetical protein
MCLVVNGEEDWEKYPNIDSNDLRPKGDGMDGKNSFKKVYKDNVSCLNCFKKGHVNCFYTSDKMDCDIIFKNVFLSKKN